MEAILIFFMINVYSGRFPLTQSGDALLPAIR